MSETKITKMIVQKEGRKLIFNPAGDVDLSQYYTKSEIDSKFNNYALKTEIPDTSTLATKTELNSVNSTANSAKTTARNALNIANTKFSFNGTNRTAVKNATTFTRNVYGEGRASGFSGNRGSIYINGLFVGSVTSYSDSTTWVKKPLICIPGDVISGEGGASLTGFYL